MEARDLLNSETEADDQENMVVNVADEFENTCELPSSGKRWDGKFLIIRGIKILNLLINLAYFTSIESAMLAL